MAEYFASETRAQTSLSNEFILVPANFDQLSSIFMFYILYQSVTRALKPHQAEPSNDDLAHLEFILSLDNPNVVKYFAYFELQTKETNQVQTCIVTDYCQVTACFCFVCFCFLF